MARALLVGCGCRGRMLAAALAEEGYAVRGTTRDLARAAEIEAAGAEAVVADPDRLGTIVGALPGVSVVCWLLGSASGDADAIAALHGPRLRSLLEALVDSPVRGVVYEAAGIVASAVLEDGAAAVREAGARHRMPVETVIANASEPQAWTAAMAAGVTRVLAGSGGPPGR